MSEGPVGESGGFASILFRDGGAALPAERPGFFRDLNFDAIVQAVLAGRAEYELEPFFALPLASGEDVEYRHGVFRELERDAVRAPVLGFAEDVRWVRRGLVLAEKQHYRLEKQRWFLDAATRYAHAVGSLRDALAGLELDSRGLLAFRGFLDAYTAAGAFASLADDARTVLEGLERVRYTVRIKGNRVRVDGYEQGSDYSAEIGETFDRFRQGAHDEHLAMPPDTGSMDSVEAQIAQLVTKLYPAEFAALGRFCSDHRGFLDGTVARFDCEVQFYLAWLEHVERLEAAGLRFCYPAVSASKEVSALGAFDLALAAKLTKEGVALVRNDFRLDGRERILVVSGPNQGGKTTFARMVGQLHQLARLGAPVPAIEARLGLADEIYTHFEREEDVATRHGKLDDELIRVREILDQASSESVVILNEIFASTTLADAVLLGADVLGELARRGCIAVCVTFLDELASLGEATVSMVATVEPDDPSRRTFRVVRKAADGRAYAWALAEKYGLAYEQLRTRVGR